MSSAVSYGSHIVKESMVRKAADGKERVVLIPQVSVLGDDIVNKVPIFRSKAHPPSRAHLAAFRLLKVGVGDCTSEFYVDINKTEAAGVHTSSIPSQT